MIRSLAMCVALTACVDGPEVGQLDQDIEIYCPGMTTSGIQTFHGLSGTYRRMNLPFAGEPLRLTLLSDTEEPHPHGTFSGTRATETGGAAPYAGLFGGIIDNPAIGAAFFLDLDADGEWDELYSVIGSSRLLGHVQSLCLVAGGHPFQLSRTLY
jgi:hypothetical protein